MFARTVSLWRRMVGKPTTDQDDRRLWIRYPADLTTQVQPADHPGEDRISAQVRDISRGGANLLLEKPYRPGQMLDLQLRRPDAPEHVLHLLACVVRVNADPAGSHSLGCVFARELSEDDLDQFGASRVRHAPEDQRTWMRFPCQLQASFHKVCEPDQHLHEAKVINISASGVGLDVGEETEVGALLNVHVVGKHGHERTLIACVVHAAEASPGRWNLGCNFIRELTEEDFQDLM